jgi:hypothetical protein
MLRSPGDTERVIEDALSLEQDMSALLAGLSGDWSFETLHVNGPGIYAGYLHLFRHFPVAHTLISLSAARIALHDIMVKAYFLHPDPDSLNLPTHTIHYVRNASKIICQLQFDILAVVPQLLGGFLPQFGFISSFLSKTRGNSPKDPM